MVMDLSVCRVSKKKKGAARLCGWLQKWWGAGRPRNNNSRLLGELTDDGRVFGFLKKCFLRWLESLFLIGKLSSGLPSIRKILHAAQVCY